MPTSIATYVPLFARGPRQRAPCRTSSKRSRCRLPNVGVLARARASGAVFELLPPTVGYAVTARIRSSAPPAVGHGDTLGPHRLVESRPLGARTAHRRRIRTSTSGRLLLGAHRRWWRRCRRQHPRRSAEEVAGSAPNGCRSAIQHAGGDMSGDIGYSDDSLDRCPVSHALVHLSLDFGGAGGGGTRTFDPGPRPRLDLLQRRSRTDVAVGRPRRSARRRPPAPSAARHAASRDRQVIEPLPVAAACSPPSDSWFCIRQGVGITAMKSPGHSCDV